MDAGCLADPRALISRSAILHNIKVLRRSLCAGTKICAMVKADAYGHGAAMVADALTNFSSDHIEGPAVDALAVVTLDEAHALGPVHTMLMVLRPLEYLYIWQQRKQIEWAIRAGWVLTVGTPAAAGDLARMAMACGRRAGIQIMIDTGVNREGTSPDAVASLVSAIDSSPSLKLTALCTHFVSSEEPSSASTLEQLRVFHRASNDHAARNPRLIRHAANTGAIFFTQASHLDMVRPGIGIYGIDPTCRPNIDRPVRPVLKWVAPLLMIRSVRKGEAVGYNQTWQADRETKIGLVPVGYADGYLRSFSNRAKMIVHGKAAPVIGRVSMDYTTIDLGGVPEATVGDHVTVLDNDPLSPASAYALAQWAGTIPYEIFCRIGARVRRVAVDPADSMEKPAWDFPDSTSVARSA